MCHSPHCLHTKGGKGEEKGSEGKKCGIEGALRRELCWACLFRNWQKGRWLQVRHTKSIQKYHIKTPHTSHKRNPTQLLPLPRRCFKFHLGGKARLRWCWWWSVRNSFKLKNPNNSHQTSVLTYLSELSRKFIGSWDGWWDDDKI